MNIIGKTTIHPLLFYSGKISGYFTWIVLILSILNIHFIEGKGLIWNKYIAVAFVIAGLGLSVLSLINLGSSTRLGLPSEITTFKTNGLYKYSRNPMYVGFNFLTIASMLYVWHIIILFLGLYSIIIYHFIILGEERFMESRFGEEYINYKQKVRRYISMKFRN